jgi:hypothetical protein
MTKVFSSSPFREGVDSPAVPLLRELIPLLGRFNLIPLFDRVAEFASEYMLFRSLMGADSGCKSRHFPVFSGDQENFRCDQRKSVAQTP